MAKGSKRYIVATGTDSRHKPHWTRPGGQAAALDALDRRAKRRRAGGFRLKERGDRNYGRRVDYRELRSRARARMGHLRIGEVLQVLNEGNLDVYLVRAIQIEAIVPDTVGNRAIDKIHGALWSWRPKLNSWGICARRKIAGTTTWSQHSPWPRGPNGKGSNAEDVQARTMAEGDAVAAKLRRLKQDGLPVGLILWRVPSHYDHVHYQGEPERTGQPRSSCP